jgi:hypothetical protein
MTGRKTLREVRAELESALGAGPAGGGQVAEALRRFLAAGSESGGTRQPAPHRTAGRDRLSKGGRRTRHGGG